MEALARALRHFKRHLRVNAVTPFCDSTAVVAYVNLRYNRQYGTKFRLLCAATWNLLLWCQGRIISLRASDIAGRENLTADALSSGVQTKTEWSLRGTTCRSLFRLLGTQILICSRRQITRSSRYSAFGPSTPEGASNALIDWEGIEALSNIPSLPLICLIHKVLLTLSRKRRILITTYWRRRAWFTLLLSLLAGTTRSLPD
ncbi:hypothetical protein BSL78_25124 [Apostichopus japonicus]|uniref:Uncharacterized protein n=1 Tax=Stichopus japonicus TaxID=307972 RepID=A0A2G8JQM9_STIJA|nr:hypothetical protein BSL78_25124 [Apostichopus japonicus]